MIQRQQQVQDLLTVLNADRTAQATQLRDDLGLFMLALQQNTQDFLQQTAQERQLRQDQVRSLQAQTADFLALAAMDRTLMAQELSQRLQQFHADLMQTVDSLRSDLQARISALKTVTQVQLAQHCHNRLDMGMQLRQDLALYVDQLRVDIDTYLAELEVLRQARGYEVQQMLQECRQERLADVEDLFTQFAEFRAELQDYRSQLSRDVWGEEGLMARSQVKSAMPSRRLPTAPSRPAAAKASAAPQATPSPKAAPSAVRQSTARQSAARQSAARQPAQAVQPVTQPAQPAAQRSPRSRPAAPAAASKPAARPAAKPLAQPPVAQTAPAAPATTATLPRAAAAHESATSVPVSLPSEADANGAAEQAVYDCICASAGMRISEIELRLNLSRFQIVDALRALIRQGKVKQRDRVYLVNKGVTS
jgi:hypothetical protein